VLARQSEDIIVRRFALAVLIAAVAGWPAAATVTDSEGNSVSPSEFLMPRDQEVALARSAAPDRVAQDATIMVLTRNGYETVVTGSNGFTCLVIRSFGNPTHAHEYMYMPDTIVPECLDANATKTILPMQRFRAELAMRSTPPAEIERQVKEGFRSGRFQRTQTVSFSYMMSAAMTFAGGHQGPAHVMIYLPDNYSNAMLGGFPFRDRFVIVEGGPDEPFVAANIYLVEKAVQPKTD
jgi:hypothetical protein